MQLRIIIRNQSDNIRTLIQTHSEESRAKKPRYTFQADDEIVLRIEETMKNRRPRPNATDVIQSLIYKGMRYEDEIEGQRPNA